MKAARVYVLVIAALLGGAVLLGRSFAQPPSPAAGPTKVAVCDVVKVFNNYNRAKDLTANLNEKRETVKAEAEKRLQAINTIGMEIEELIQGSKEYERRFNDVQRLTIERTAWLQYQEALVMRDHHRLTKEMYEEIIKMVGLIAREQGVQIVLSRMGEDLQSENTPQLLQQIERRKVLYATDSVDLTDTVLKRLNEAYRASK
jgi:Skp family chaperone for outer membrane proteins